MNSAVYEQIYYSFKYDDSGYRTSKTYLGQTTNYYNDNRKSKFKVFRRQIVDLQANFIIKFVDFCFNDIVPKKSNRLFGKAESSAAKRLVAFSTYYNHYYDGGLLLGEERGGNVFIYLYDTNGSPIGMQYHAANTAKSVWESYWFEKNLQGDIITTIESRNSKYFDGKS